MEYTLENIYRLVGKQIKLRILPLKAVVMHSKSMETC